MLAASFFTVFFNSLGSFMYQLLVVTDPIEFDQQVAELSQKIYEPLEAGVCPVDIATAFGVSWETMYNVKRKYETTGSFNTAPRSRRPKTTQTEENIETVKATIEESLRQNICQMARELGINTSTVSRVVNEDLGMKSRAVISTQLLTEKLKEKCLNQCKILLNNIKKRLTHVLVFSDEKLFYVDAISNTRTLRSIAVTPKSVPDNVRYQGRDKHPSRP